MKGQLWLPNKIEGQKGHVKKELYRDPHVIIVLARRYLLYPY